MIAAIAITFLLSPILSATPDIVGESVSPTKIPQSVVTGESNTTTTTPREEQCFATLDGNKYTNVVVKRVEPDGIVVANQDGIRKIKFKNLPPEVSTKYGYDSEKAVLYQKTVTEAKIAAQQNFTEQQKIQAIQQQQNAQLLARFDAWSQEMTQLEDMVRNAKDPDPFKLNNDENRAKAAAKAKVFEARFVALRQLIATLDQAGASYDHTKHLIDAVHDGKIFVGMPSAFVILSWGKPTKINSTYSRNSHSEQWVYNRNDEVESSFVYVEDGLVTSIQN